VDIKRSFDLKTGCRHKKGVILNAAGAGEKRKIGKEADWHNKKKTSIHSLLIKRKLMRRKQNEAAKTSKGKVFCKIFMCSGR